MPSLQSVCYLVLSSLVLLLAYRQDYYWYKTPRAAMQSQSDIGFVAGELLAKNRLRLVSTQTLQSLWAGYGHICRVLATPQQAEADGGDAEDKETPLILKYITPPQMRSRPDEGHIRKLLSYQVELAFYTHLAPLLPQNLAVASCVASLHSLYGVAENNHAAAVGSGNIAEFKLAMLLTDLSVEFPVAGEKRATLSLSQVYAALDWLAGFHGFWWERVQNADGGGPFQRGKLVRPPLVHLKEHQDMFMGPAAAAAGSGDGGVKAASVWLNGGYMYLETRRGEYASLCKDTRSEWAAALCQPVEGRNASVAELVAQVLTPGAEGPGSGILAEFETLIHGDVKSENLFANKAGDRVAFYDFQYVGLGFGVCDLAKLFTCAVPSSELGRGGGDHGGRQQLLPMEQGEQALLRYYLERMRDASGQTYPWDAFVRHWETALVDWLRFQASWGFWGNTEWLEGRVRSILADETWREWLLAATG